MAQSPVSTKRSRGYWQLASFLAVAATTFITACSSDPDADGNASGTGGVATGTGGDATGSGGVATGTGGDATGTGGVATGTGGAGVDACTAGDSCPAANGISWDCQKRFMYGTNWAWQNWGADFGGITAWGKKGVSEDPDTFSATMATLKSNSVSVIRWWMWPRFLTESITWGADDAPSAVGGTLIADVQKALELAEQNDVYIMFTPFSFDNFKATKDESGINSRGMTAMILDDAKRAKVIENLMRPVAQAIEASPYKKRMIAWDLINEPEWAMTGANPNGGEDFGPPEDGMEAVTHAQMKTFTDELTVMLRQESTALITIGSAAIKWGTAWKGSDVDFYSLHYYDWVYQWYPYNTVTLASKGLTDKPVVMGEFPYTGFAAHAEQSLPAKTVGEFLSDLWTNGYAGALGWAYTDTTLPFDAPAQAAFHDLHTCETTY